jgi:hypothetical protein
MYQTYCRFKLRYSSLKCIGIESIAFLNLSAVKPIGKDKNRMDRVLTKWTVVLFTQILSLSSQKNLGLGSGILKKHIPDHGSKEQKDTGSRIRIRNTDW